MFAIHKRLQSASSVRILNNFSTIISQSNPPRQKHKTPWKRASGLLEVLKREEFEILKNGRTWTNIRSGDSVVIEKLPYVTSPTPEIIKGVVIAKTNRASDSALSILNCEFGTPVLRRITMYSPLIKSIEILQKAFIHQGKKRVRRSKLYYLLERDPREYTVK